MQKLQIRQKLNSFFEDFKKEKGGFKSLEIMYNYVNFLKSEEYIQEALKDIWANVVMQRKILTEKVNDLKLDNVVFDPKAMPELPIFEKEMAVYQKKIIEKDESFNKIN